MKAVLMFAFVLMYIGLCGYAIFEGLPALFYVTTFSIVLLGMNMFFDGSEQGKRVTAMVSLSFLWLAIVFFGMHWFR